MQHKPCLGVCGVASRRVLPAVLVLIAGVALAGAAGAQAPPKADCAMEVDSGARIKCRFGNIIDQQRAAADMISFMPGVPESQKQALRNQVERTSRAQGRAAEDDFLQLTRRKKPKCQVVEFLDDMGMPIGMGDGDGICRGNETCAEVLGDQIGNEDGKCQRGGGPNREICVEICDEEAINDDPDNFDGSLGADVEEQLEEITDQYVELNTMLDEELQVRAAARILVANGDPCAAVLALRSDTGLFGFLVGLAAGTRMGADIAERFCDQTAFGANTAAVCAVIEGVAGAAGVTATVFQFGDATIDSETIDATYGCVQSLDTAVGGLTASAGQTSAALAAIQQTIADNQAAIEANQATIQSNQALIQANQALIIDLLRTPTGLTLETPPH